MNKVIHIGFPKNFSTSLQRSFFSKHPNIYHLGIGIDNNLGYINDDIEVAVECFLKYSKEIQYCEYQNHIKKSFQICFSEAEKKTDCSLVSISSEHFSFPFTNDVIDTSLIAFRLSEIFPEESKILVIIRNQWDLIKSLYRECIRVGYAQPYNEFVNYLYRFQDRNFLLSLCYDRTLNLYARHFKPSNFGIFLFENYRGDNKQLSTNNLIKDLSTFLQIPYVNLPIKHYNEALSDSAIIKKRELNRLNKHDLGNILYDGAENHRLNKYYSNILNLELEEKDVFKDVITKRKLMKESIDHSISHNIDYSIDSKIEKKINKIFKKSNQNLANTYNVNLTSNYLQ